MSNRWQEAYTELQDFIAADPGIEVSTNFVVIPGEVRAEFYRLFDNARLAFLEEKFPVLTREAAVLSENYIKAEKEVTELLKLDSIFVLPSLHRFVHDPTNELIRGLLDPLFDLLRGKASPDSFEQLALKNIDMTFKNCLKLGYAKWVALTIVKLLGADKLFNVTPPESKVSPHGEPLHLEKPVPTPEESRELSFEHGPHLFPPFILPHFIVHSARLNRYVSVRTELVYNAEYSALNASEEREWLSLDDDSIAEKYTLAAPNPSLLIYIGDKPEELALVADKYSICRPDLIVECRLPEDWHEKEKPAEVEFYEFLSPKLGRYVVSRESVPEQLSQESVPGPVSPQPLPERGSEKEEEKPVVHNLTVGFGQSNLEPVIEAVMNFDSRGSGRKVQLFIKGERRLKYYPD